MEENKTQTGLPGHPQGCYCYGCRCGSYTWGHGHYWLRWILGLLILCAVFCLGVKVGEFKGYYGLGHGFDSYGGGYRTFMMKARPPYMMGNQVWQEPAQFDTSATPQN